MNRYSEYKDSGINWIGEIPRNWEVKKLKYATLVNPLKDDFHKIPSEPVTFLPMDKVSENGEIDCSVKKPVSSLWSGFTFFRKNDVVVAKITPCFENGKSALLNKLETNVGFGSTEFHVLRPGEQIDNKFLYYVIKSEIFRKIGTAFMSGAAGQKRVPTNFISDFPLVSPSKEDQTQIAQYLDKEISRINSLVEKAKRKIELLKEQRTALINQCVTKGLDPNVEMKDSGIEWIGEIPVGWETVSLKWKSRIYAGGTPDKNRAEYWLNGTIPWLNSGAVNQFFITEPSDFITEEGFRNSSANWIEKESIVVALAGQGKTKGMVGITAFKTTCNQSLSAIQPASDIDSRYLLYYLRANYLNIRGLAGEGKRDGLNLEVIGSITIPLFSKIEQTEIAQYLGKEIFRIDSLVEKETKRIALLKEYRQSLISNVVTGKVRVTEETV